MDKIKAIQILDKVLAGLDSKDIRYESDSQFIKWRRGTAIALEKVFGKESKQVKEFNGIIYSPVVWSSENYQLRKYAAFENGMKRARALLESMREEVQEYWEESSVSPSVAITHVVKDKVSVFVVHGRNVAYRESAARLIQKLGLDPIILHEQPNKGRTIIEKFTDYANVSYAVVLLTADDVGGLDSESLRARARQNVIFELGFFIGRLGREHVVALYEEGVEIPSDYQGVLFVPLDSANAWHFHVARELKAAGFSIDMNKIA